MGPDHLDRRPRGAARRPARHPAHQLQDARLPAAAAGGPRRCGPATSPTRCATWCSTSSTPTTAPRAPTWPCCCAASAPRSAWPATDAPLGRRSPVATSATLGHRRRRRWPQLRTSPPRSSASTSTTPIIGETRQTVEEACRTTNYRLPIPDASDGRRPRRPRRRGRAPSVADRGPGPESADHFELGERLLAHPLTRAVLTAVGDRSRSWPDAVRRSWRSARLGTCRSDRRRSAVERRWPSSSAAVGRARRQGERERPLFSVEVQLWIREVSRLLRTVSTVTVVPLARLRRGDRRGRRAAVPGSELPAVYCRRCGMSGWMASAIGDLRRARHQPQHDLLRCSDPIAAGPGLMRAHPDDADGAGTRPGDRSFVDEPDDDTVARARHSREDDARAQPCPACGDRDAIRFLGLAVASARLGRRSPPLFGSRHVDDDERKLLAFTDSVQDASHRAAFFAGRTHRFNLRSLMAGIIQRGRAQVSARRPGRRAARRGRRRPRPLRAACRPTCSATPLVSHHLDRPPRRGAQLARHRLRLRGRSRVRAAVTGRVAPSSCRALPLGGAARRLDEFCGLVAEEIRRVTGELAGSAPLAWHLRRPAGTDAAPGRTGPRCSTRSSTAAAPVVHLGWPTRRPAAVHPDQSRPSFYTTAPLGRSRLADRPAGSTPTWLVNWATRTLGIDPAEAVDLNLWTADLARPRVRRRRHRRSGAPHDVRARSNAVRRRDVRGEDGPADGVGHARSAATATPSRRRRRRLAMVCRVCATGASAGSRRLPRPTASILPPALPHREPPDGSSPANTPACSSDDRPGRPRARVQGRTAPDAPNVADRHPDARDGHRHRRPVGGHAHLDPAQPGLLHPAGRSRRPGHRQRLVTTFVRTDTHGLYYLAEPEAMISGEIRPPDCYLDADETLPAPVPRLRRRPCRRRDDRRPHPAPPDRAADEDRHGRGRLPPRRRRRRRCSIPATSSGSSACSATDLATSTVDRLRTFAAGGIEVTSRTWSSAGTSS